MSYYATIRALLDNASAHFNASHQLHFIAIAEIISDWQPMFVLFRRHCQLFRSLLLIIVAECSHFLYASLDNLYILHEPALFVYCFD